MRILATIIHLVSSASVNYVGGIIFYIDSTADGTYSFWDANGDPVAAPTVGTDCTGWTYEESGISKDKYYVYSSDTVFSNGNGSIENPYKTWTYYDEENQSYIDNTSYFSGEPADYTYLGYKGRVYEPLYNSVTYDAVGKGKSNTSSMMAIERTVTIDGTRSTVNAYVQGPQRKSRNDSKFAETIWYVCSEFNNDSYQRKENTTGCSDWYIPSIEELELLYNSFANCEAYLIFLLGEKGAAYVWSSTASDNVSTAKDWRAVTIGAGTGQSGNDLRNSYYYLLLIRSF